MQGAPESRAARPLPRGFRVLCQLDQGPVLFSSGTLRPRLAVQAQEDLQMVGGTGARRRAQASEA